MSSTRRHTDLDRLCAASLVRAARRAANVHGGKHSASEHLDWALYLAPLSRQIERARIRLFIREGNVEAAESLIARALIQRPDDLPLRILRAKCLTACGDYAGADAILREVLAKRPNRRDALQLAAHVVSQLGEHLRAVALLERALLRKPGDERIIAQLGAALMETGEVDDAEQAERLLASVRNPPPALLARALLAQGRVRDAIDYLETRLDGYPAHAEHRNSITENPAQHDALLAQYVLALETAGEVHRIDALLDTVNPAAHPQTAAALARIMLAQGRFRAAIALTLPALRRSNTVPSAEYQVPSGDTPYARHDARSSVLGTRSSVLASTKNEERLVILYIAATFASRPRLASRAWSCMTHSALRTQNPGPASGLGRGSELALWIDGWRRGFRGRMIHDQRTPHSGATIGCDPSISVLQPLLREAVRIFESKPATCNGKPAAHDSESDLAICRAALTSDL